ncbi:MAG TPA: TetR family transcriptional regulator [Pseudolabrys sp.]|jgi:AcrR family transcriptional regulator|nr:TetR family transcriptional regulator [Pseudolabrys sp.]
MARNYTLKKRAEQQAETRQRIVDAAIVLHTEIGPSKTTFSMVADKAGVQRHTLYAHFPDERSLVMACSAHMQEKSPPPDAAPWRGIKNRRERLTAGLAEIYGWFEANAQLLSSVLRDAEHYALVQEVSKLRYAPAIGLWHEVLEAGLKDKQRAMVSLALSFYTWRTLTRDSGLKTSAAVTQMVDAIESA